MRIIGLIIGLFIALTAMGQSGSMIANTYTYGGEAREYKLYVPTTYDGSEAVPLIFNLHGYTSNMDQQIAYGDFRSIADTANFLIVHPNGTFDQSGNRFWNAFGASGVDDVGFLSSLIDTINNEYNIDLNRLYSTGMSNGGYMSFELACQLGNRIAAVASVTGAMTSNRISACNAPKPTPIMQIHGTQDPTVPYNGGTNNVAIPDVIDYWVQQTNCNTTPTIDQVPDTDPNDGCTAEHHVYTGGDQGATVEHFKIEDGGHTWPGAPVNIGVTNQDIDASIEIWRFFSQYSKDDLVGLDNEEGNATNELFVFPNPGNGLFKIEGDVAVESYTVRDMSGRLIHSQSDSDVLKSIDLRTAGSGVYVVELVTEKRRVQKRLIVE
ncbi:MAG: extracellular catalytic domain type 1 short-chain-length polyhydroxyalkanoate depolymerase [Bacteroidota bacterium]